jgi:exodeoxyribonuclease V alpha subunit
MSQASPFPQFVLQMRNLFYNGITRGRRLVMQVGETNALKMAVEHGAAGERYGGLLARLKGGG